MSSRRMSAARSESRPGPSEMRALPNPAGQDRKGKGTERHGQTTRRVSRNGFMLKAAGLGFGVAKPCGDGERYDFILDSGERLGRVQVKSTYVARSHSYQVSAKGCLDGKGKAYMAEQIDILIAYIVAEDD